jgi:hypothetical protein
MQNKLMTGTHFQVKQTLDGESSDCFNRIADFCIKQILSPEFHATSTD